MNPNPTTAPFNAAAAPALAGASTRHLAVQLGGAALLALALFYGVAFAHSPLAHNAAHDVRHVTVKPCH